MAPGRPLPRLRNGRVKPDALFYFGTYYYFLEIERSKQGKYIDGKSEVMRKIENYEFYADRVRRPYQERTAYLFEWGELGDGPGQFDLVHGLAVDRDRRVYVGDRSNNGIWTRSP